MAARRSAQYPYQWPNGTWHSTPAPPPPAAAPAPPKGVQRAPTPPPSSYPALPPSTYPIAPAKGVLRAPTPPSAPGAAAAAPGGAPAPGGFIPDAEYLAAAAQAAFQRNQQIEQLNTEGANDKTNFNTAITRLLTDVPKQRQAIREGANKEGLFYSGQLTKRLGDYEQALQRSQDDLNTGYGQREGARQAALTALQQGAPLDDAQLQAAAAARRIAADTVAADAGALAPPAVAATPARAAVAAAQKLMGHAPRRRHPRSR